jgi:hypothetical protein
MAKVFATCLLVIVGTWRLVAVPTTALPNRPDSVKFAVLGDNGSGDKGQEDVAGQMVAIRRLFAFDFVIMLGDNFYGPQSPADLARKFDRPYKPLLDGGVTFHAAIAITMSSRR